MKTLDYPPLSAQARSQSDAARVLHSLQNRGACFKTFHNHSNILERGISWGSECVKTPMPSGLELPGWTESDDGMLQSLDLHDSRSAMITFLGRSNHDDGSKARPITPLCTLLTERPKTQTFVKCKCLQHFQRVSQLCPSLVALTRFLPGKGWPRTSKSELMGSYWFTVKILLSLIHDISDNRGYHSEIFVAILSIFHRWGSKRENLHVQ